MEGQTTGLTVALELGAGKMSGTCCPNETLALAAAAVVTLLVWIYSVPAAFTNMATFICDKAAAGSSLARSVTITGVHGQVMILNGR